MSEDQSRPLPPDAACAHPGTVHPTEIEGAARAIIETAGYGLDEAPGALALARGLGVQVALVDWLRGEDSAAWDPAPSGIPRAIALRHGLSPLARAWRIAHELAEIDLRTCNYRDEDIEAAAESLAAAVLMPRAAFRAAVAEIGEDIAALAGAFAVPETAAALRLAEVGAIEAAAVVTPRIVHVRRSDEAIVMPSERELRYLARTAAPGLRRLPLTDQRDRIALLAG